MIVRVIAASVFAVFVAAGCASQKSQPPPEITKADIDRVEMAAKQAEAAAKRAEVAAEKAEVIFNKSLQK